MMLRESSRHSAEAVNLGDVTAGVGEGTQVAYAPMLVGFAEAVVRHDAAGTAGGREAIRRAMGDAAFVDVAATVAAFHGFVRIADAIGIPYTTAAMGGDAPDVRAAAGVDDFYRLREDRAAGRL